MAIEVIQCFIADILLPDVSLCGRCDSLCRELAGTLDPSPSRISSGTPAMSNINPQLEPGIGTQPESGRTKSAATASTIAIALSAVAISAAVVAVGVGIRAKADQRDEVKALRNDVGLLKL